MVWAPDTDWAEDLVEECAAFPHGDNDDLVDSCVDSSTQVTMKDAPSKRIDEIKVGEYVKTPQGYQKVLAVHKNGFKEIWKVKTGNKTLLATADHKVFTQRGYVRVDSLIQSVDNVYFTQESISWHLKAQALLLKPLYLITNAITDTLKAITLRIVDTLAEQGTGCIGMCGNFTKAKYQRDTTYTTSMGIHQTTTSQILNAYPEKSTTLNTQNLLVKEAGLQSILHILIELGNKQRFGTLVKKVVHGIKSMLKTQSVKHGGFLGSIRKLKQNVSGAAQKCLLRLHIRNSALPDVNQPNQNSVSVSLVRNTHIMQEVYDITVENEHCYYANGILVHNCVQALNRFRAGNFISLLSDLEEEERKEGVAPEYY
jgi:hypothetical protein